MPLQYLCKDNGHIPAQYITAGKAVRLVYTNELNFCTNHPLDL